MAQSYAGFVVMYAWISSSFPRPPSKRAVALALVNAFSQVQYLHAHWRLTSEWSYLARQRCWIVNLPLVIFINESPLTWSQIRMAEYMGADLPQFLCDLHSLFWDDHRVVFNIQTVADPCEPEVGRGGGGAGSEDAWIPIYTVITCNERDELDE
jgi:hypothetical protein